jgi:hypothetical protein
VPNRQNIDGVGFKAVEKPIWEIEESDHPNARPLRDLWRAEREFSNATLDCGQAPLESRARHRPMKAL